MRGSRAAQVAYYGVPMLFCLAVHWIALKTWFQSDDFAWLGLRLEVHSPHDLLQVLFRPLAQGTIRTVGERLYFLIFPSLFGLNAAPLRVWAFLTQFANIALLIAVTRRVTGSALAGFVAPILWSANAALAIALDWSSAYNEICCAFFMLLAFYFFLRYIDTGESKFWLWQWLSFLLGFGALELNVMYPALAASYALCCARPYFRRTLYLFIPSIVFTLLHFLYIPKTVDPAYVMHFDAGILWTLWNYWSFALAAWRPMPVDWRPVWLATALTICVTAALGAYIAVRARRKDWRGLFFVAWFFLVILPVLPLTHHISEYYPTIPVIGMAMLGAWALASGGARWKYALALAYLVVSIAEVRSADRYFYARARLMKRLITGLQATSAEHAGKMILLNGVDNDLFGAGFWDDPFRLIGIHDIRLTPGSEKSIEKHAEWGGISRYVISPEEAVAALNKNQAVVYAVDSQGIRNVTSTYRAIVTAEQLAQHRETIDVGNSVYTGWLGPGWYKIEDGSRWMAKSASVHLSGPQRPGQRLYVNGYCPEAVLEKGPITLTLSADGTKLGSATLKDAGPFALQFPLPAGLAGKYEVGITAEVDRTITPQNDPRQLGLLFGTFAIR